MKRPFDSIIIHCTATKAGRTVHVADVRKWHQAQGWDDIGYHYLIALDGTIEVGRHIDVIGAHCRGHNHGSVGICYVGGLDQDGKPADTRTPAQKESLARLIWRLSLIAVNNGWGLPKVRGHRDYTKSKACPCFDARQEYD